MSIEQDLGAEKVSHLDLTSFSQVSSGTPLLEVLSIMRDKQLSAVLVTEQDRLIGIFTERDVLSRVADEPSTWKLPVDDMMTGSPQTVSPDAMVQEALHLMNAGHYRNVPVVDGDGKVVGNLSQYSIVKFLTDQYPREIYNLPPDPESIPRTREGA
jgi:CBS domain-containing protein